MSRSTARSMKNPLANGQSGDVDLIETSPEVKSYIYQQLVDFQPYVTPETLVYVIARNPSEAPEGAEDHFELPEEKYKHRIAIILQEGETTIEAEAYHDDIYYAIRLAKDSLLERLTEIEDEVEPREKKAATAKRPGNNQLH